MTIKLHATLSVVPASPGFYPVLDFPAARNVVLGHPVIAWRIESYMADNNDYTSSCMALTAEGEVARNCIGIRNPDQTVTVFGDASYASLDELRRQRYGK